MIKWGKFAAIVSIVTLATAAAAAVFIFSLEGESTHRFNPKARPELAGNWESSNGGTMRFEENGDFSATNIGLELVCSAKKNRKLEPRMSGSGEWKFGSYPDEGPGIVVAFKPEGLGVADCTVWGRFGGDEENPRIYLLQDDGTPEYYQRPVSK
ncbi:hypothetical protein OG594_06985 [Streptomyces sp. NBC_01214]|uniref:hypothetical protein n=1 Tax=Streptomyces sp. NBC_01214 TaxID=2903777 RepID=UPI0022544DD2|nr:hypothetical protein [Streptomyces sp. NBC_01214]MCX4801398.1 hypothetical protein [Streptomyces sp. NBC_01214]